MQALLMGRDMEIVKQILMGQRTGNHNYFIFDGNYDHFYYIPNNHAGEIMLKLLCSEALSAELDRDSAAESDAPAGGRCN